MRKIKRGIKAVFAFCICFTLTFQTSMIKADTTPELTTETSEHFGEEDSKYGYRQPPAKVEVQAATSIPGRKRSSVLPSRYDGRAAGHMTSVKNQKDVGACWAFSGIGLFESKVKTSTGVSTDLSEQHMLWTMNGLTGSGYMGNTTNGYGGNEWMSAGYYASGFGPKSEQDIPFISKVFYFASAVRPINLASASKLYQATDIQFLDPTNDKEIKQAVIDNGAVGTGIYWDFSSQYHKGDSYYYSGPLEDKQNNKLVQNHEVIIVGWDDTYSKTNFSKTPSKDGAWLIKNSWGSNASYSDGGYQWVSYDDPFLLPDYTIKSFKAYDPGEKLYQLDEFGAVNSIDIPEEISADTCYFANVFDFGKNEKLESITFFTDSIGSKYHLYLAPVNSSGVPDLSKKEELTAEQTVPYVGYITAKTSAKNVSGKYAVVLMLKKTKTDQMLNIGLECSDYYKNGDCYYKGTIERGQSFVKLGEQDINDIYTPDDGGNRLCNFSIKATTKVETLSAEKQGSNTNQSSKPETKPVTKPSTTAVQTTTAVRPATTYKKPYLSKGSLSIYKGNKTAIGIKNKVSGAKVTFASSKKSIATVSSKGTVTGKKAGTATITVKVTQQGKSYTLNCKVKVNNKRLAFSKKKAKIKKKKSFTFKVKKYGVSGKVRWKVSNKKLASIGKTNGKFKAKKKKGKVKVTAYCGKFKVSYTVRIY